jgi:UDPglucose 6-dehydrogenase
MSENIEKIAVIGLGKLGLPMLSAFITRGFDVYGYDLNPELISTLKNNINPYKEPGIDEVISSDLEWKNRFFDNLDNIIEKASILFLIVPTPTKGEIFDISFLQKSLKDISAVAKIKNKKLTCVITSTVNPGDCNNIQEQVDSQSAGLLKLVYSPEFIALGSVLRDMLHPDIVLLGGNHIESVDKIFSIYSRLYLSFPEYHRLSFFEAETAKIAINTFVTTKISFANMIGMFIEKSTGCRVRAQKVLDAIGGDSRIGRKYFKYGLSYGGPCFPRDNRVFTSHLVNKKINAGIPKATDDVNNSILNYWEEKIRVEKYDAIVLGGLAYKAGTDFLEESFMIKLGKCMLEKNIAIFYYDALVNNYEYFIKLNANNHLDLLTNFTKVLVLKNYDEFKFNNKLINLFTVNVWN